MSKKTRLAMLTLGAVVLFAGIAPAVADALDEQQAAQRKLMAYRAARADAIRRLAERIMGVQITSSTTVKDFVTESDTIDAATQAFISGMKEEGKPKYMEDGTCSVKMSITIQEVVVTLKQIYEVKKKGDKVKIDDINNLTSTVKESTFTEVGSGAPPAAGGKGQTLTVGPNDDVQMLDMPKAAADYWKERVTGQGRLMAIRAAELDATRRLAERIKGVMITSQTSVRDFVAESDEINVDMKTFIVGVKIVRLKYHDDELIVEATGEVKLRTVLESFKKWADIHCKGSKVNVAQIEERIIEVKEEMISETGMGIPPSKFLKGVDETTITALESAVNTPPWTDLTERAVGNAAIDANAENKAQAKLMAYRAAELDARRKLAEKLSGLVIKSKTTVKDFVAQNDEIKTAMGTYQLGATVVENSQKVNEDGTVSVAVEINLLPLWDNVIVYYQKKLNITIK